MLIFQFTLPREERRQVQAQPLTLQNFNPRSHERSDHITQSFVFRFFNFNPRSHERSDIFFMGVYPKMYISIHAPTRGATKLIKRNSDSSDNFNPRSHERSDSYSNHMLHQFQYFNPRSHERSDIFFMGVYPKMYISIHAPTRGATMLSGVPLSTQQFQSTLPREERLNQSTLLRDTVLFQSTLPREERPR